MRVCSLSLEGEGWREGEQQLNKPPNFVLNEEPEGFYYIA
jgi:hypothetical protein